MKKTIIASALMCFFSTAAFASGRCTPSSYQYRVDLIAKKSAATFQALVRSTNILKQAGDELYPPGEFFRRPPSTLKVYFTLFKTSMSWSNAAHKVTTKIYWLNRDIQLLKTTCPMYNAKDIAARITTAVKKAAPPGWTVSLNLDGLATDQKNQQDSKASAVPATYQAASYTPPAASNGAR